ncbi:triokinase/FMN cyclase [Patella vulgata]|uniref:triokinase/FMN cyclase n=1 Tax=Patella vulgata TaxID=6465 RepID=UPI00217FCBCB|nr:triokinase/FMN cyclase [Patella vulgata]
MAQTNASKKLINTVERCVDECLEGLVAVNPGLRLLEGHRVVVRSDIEEFVKSGKVTLVCGGGSGHEPAHAGYVGPGMLSAAVAGAVFTSPPPHSILAAIRTVGKNNQAGVLVIIKNYTGDRLNFGLAVERAKAEGIKVDMVVVGEDCALTSTDKTAGRRGLCGTVFIHKIAGSLAEEGRSLEEIAVIVKDAVDSMGTIGLSLAPCSVPGSGPSFKLEQDEMELGLGIHGEAGVKRLKLTNVQTAISTMLDHMTNQATKTHLELAKGDAVGVIVNNLGGTSILELNIAAKEAISYLENKGLTVDRVYCGSFMTALEMAGISLTVLKLNEVLRDCLDSPTVAPGWSKPMLPKGQRLRATPIPLKTTESSHGDKIDVSVEETVDKDYGNLLFDIIQNVCKSLISSENRLNMLDTQAGDGDCGTTVTRGAQAILKKLGDKSSPGLPVTNPYSLTLALATIVETDMGGSSGALYSLFLTSAALCLQSKISSSSWIQALNNGITAIQRYGGAEPGDRTMLDALYGASEVLNDKNRSSLSNVELLRQAVQAAEKGAEDTAKMAAKAGRASYVNPDNLTQPDPGATAVAVWFKAILDQLV